MSCLIFLAKVSGANNQGDKGHPWHVPFSIEMASVKFPLIKIFVVSSTCIAPSPEFRDAAHFEADSTGKAVLNYQTLFCIQK